MRSAINNRTPKVLVARVGIAGDAFVRKSGGAGNVSAILPRRPRSQLPLPSSLDLSASCRLNLCGFRQEELDGFFRGATPSKAVQFRPLSRAARARRRRRRPLRSAYRSISASISSSLTAMCSRRATSSSASAPRTASAAGFTLLLAELFPVDVDLHRIDLLIHEPADEVLHPPIDFAIEERGRHLERHARRRAGSAARRACRARLRASPRARGRRERASAARRGSRTRPGPSRTRRRAPARRACESPSR